MSYLIFFIDFLNIQYFNGNGHCSGVAVLESQTTKAE